MISMHHSTRGAVAPLFFAQSKAAFQNLAWFLILNLVNAGEC